MRNTRVFELNVYDEQIDLSNVEPPELSSHALKSLDSSQKYLIESPFFRRLDSAYEKWQEVLKENNRDLFNLFDKHKSPDFASSIVNPFQSGKYWQMFENLDETHPRIKLREDLTREDYQNKLIEENLGENRELLQVGWDLAVNSALLCDMMPNKSASGNKGSLYLLENIVWDKDSLLYPSITNNFQKRLINESLWQCLCDLHTFSDRFPLERILTQSFNELDVSYAKDNILRWDGSEREFKISDDNHPLVIGSYGPESFKGISPRGIENYGRFLEKVHQSFEYQDKPLLLPFMKMYVEAVNCIDEDGIEYFGREGEKERLLGLEFVKNTPELEEVGVGDCS